MNSPDADFHLHPRLEADSVFIADLELCQFRLINDARFVWTLLVPRVDDIKEAYQLSTVDYSRLMAETRDIGAAMISAFDGDKLNIAALGNMVPQLHMHVIVRRDDDAAWPGAVWGSGQAQPYTESEKTDRIAQLTAIARAM